MLYIYCGTALQIHYEQAKWLHLLEKSKERVKKMDEPLRGFLLMSAALYLWNYVIAKRCQQVNSFNRE